MRRAKLAGRVAPAALMLVMLAVGAAAQTGRVSGVVSDETGEPIKGATVRAENPNVTPSTFTASTDDKGRFNMLGLRPGRWAFAAEAPNFSPQLAAVQVRAQGVPPLLFTLTKLFGGPVAALGSVDPEDLQDSLAEADQLFSSGQWDTALSAYRRILDRSPALSAVNLQIGAIYRQQKNYDAAIEAYRALLEREPSNGRALIGLAAANLERGDPAAAEAVLTGALEAASATDQDVLCALGDLHAARGDSAGAVTWYERAAAAAPSWSRPRYQLARLAMARGDRAGAAALMRDVVEADPLSPEADEARAALADLQP